MSRKNGLEGSIKGEPEDFVVMEITQNGTCLETGRAYTPADLSMLEDGEGRFVTFVLQKRDWNTSQALMTIAKRLHRGIKSAGYAGTKDRTAVSTQLCSMFGVKTEQFAGLHLKDISVNGAWQSKTGVELGDLLGNRFVIRVSDARGEESIDGILEELNGVFPNYFGEQRFGIRGNNAAIGVDILRGDFRGAVSKFLEDTTNETSADAQEARKRLAEEQDYANALEYFPRYLKYERMMLQSLASEPTDPAKAIRRLPRSLTLMFVHAVDAYIFNKEVEARVGAGEVAPKPGDIVCSAGRAGFPDLATARAFDGGGGFVVGNIVGYEMEPNDAEQEILGGLGLTKEDFRVRSMPELNCKGAKRVFFAPLGAFSHAQDGNGLRMEFSLPSGSYATVAMAEFLKH